MTIKLNSNARPVRQCMAEFSFMDGGEFKTEPIRVLYYTLTIKEIRENQAKEAAALSSKAKKGDEADDPQRWLSTDLAERLHSLPDVLDEEGKPLAITPELLEGFDLVNLKSIHTAINDDLSPKLTPAA